MDILVATDNNYVPQLAALLLSIVERSDCRGARIHVAHFGVTDDRLNRLRAFTAGMFSEKVRFVPCDLRDYRHFRLDEHITQAAYIRLFLSNLLPGDVDRVLYIDADTIVRRPIKALHSLQLGDAIIAAVDEPFSPEPERLGLASDHVYFNSGVMLVDVCRWRAEDVTERLLHVVRRDPHLLRYHDQDALNIVLQGRVLRLDYEWNFQARTTEDHLASMRLDRAGLAQWRRRARIVHFTTGAKPWLYYHDVPFEGEYKRFAKRTPWAAELHSDKTWRLIGRRYLLRHAPALAPLAKRKLGVADARR